MSSTIKPVLGSQLQFGHPLATGLVGLWLFNEGSGNKVYDLSGNDNAGTFIGTPSWSPGQFGSSILLPGSADYINVPYSSILSFPTGGMSISLWVKRTSATPRQEGIIGKYTNPEEYCLGFYESPARLYWFVYDNSGSDYIGRFCVNTVFDDLQWHHIVVTYDGGVLAASCKIYIDGIRSDTDDFANAGFVAMEDGSQPLTIGYCPSWDANTFSGQIDIPLIYNRALSASEVALLYREPFCMFERDPIELWSAATLGGEAPVGAAGIMTTNTGFWGPTF